VALTGGVTFGSALALGGIRVHRATAQRIDCAFFRSAYDARLILEDLAEKTRTATDRNELRSNTICSRRSNRLPLRCIWR